MIVFDLRCANNHQFEGWFDSSDDLESQLSQGQIACPSCDDIVIDRVLSPVSIKKTAAQSREMKQAYQAWGELCRYVKDNFEDVGHDFAKEALKVHYGTVEQRKIRGVTTESEEELLKKEGVAFLKIPVPQEMDN